MQATTASIATRFFASLTLVSLTRGGHGLRIVNKLLLPVVKQREVARSTDGLPLQTSAGQLGASTHKTHHQTHRQALSLI
jgi:hypothetical protein